MLGPSLRMQKNGEYTHPPGPRVSSLMYPIHARIQSFFRGVSNFDNFFFDDWIQIPLKAGHHRPVSETKFQWHLAGVPMMGQH